MSGNTIRYVAVSACAALFALFVFLSPVSAGIVEDIAAKQQQIEEIQRQIEDYQRQIDENRSKAVTLTNEINKLNAKINQIALEIQSLSIAIDKTNLEIDSTSSRIDDATQKLDKSKQALAGYIRLSYEIDQTTLTEILLNNETLSDFFGELNNVQATQDNLRISIENIKELRNELNVRKEELEDKQTELERLKRLQELERQSLDGNKRQKDRILKDTKGQETKFQELVKKSQRDLEAIRAQIFYLEQNGVSAEEAVKFGELAAIRTGIRPAYLIAVLEVESGLGRNVGRCNRAEDPPEKKWQAIMHTRDHQPFLDITSQLGKNPNETPVSCPQIVNGKRYGWGGAMGPAQFIPSTWITYADEVARLVNRPTANPWNIEDAFMAAAVKLARGGATAKTQTSEVSASKAYYSGNSRCSSAPCNSYANAIQRKAADIEQNL